jgi:heme oxygenase
VPAPDCCAASRIPEASGWQARQQVQGQVLSVPIVKRSRRFATNGGLPRAGDDACMRRGGITSQRSVDARSFAESSALSATTLECLRAETSLVHRRLDQTLGLIDRLQAPETRAALVAGYYNFHSGAEIAVAPFLSAIADLDFAARRRSPLIARDIQALGECAPTDGVPSLDIATRSEAFGALYVLEGSCLGGRLILKDLVRRASPMTGLGFLNPYGARTAELWLAFLAVLERETASRKETIKQTVAGAMKAFAFAELCLSKESTN